MKSQVINVFTAAVVLLAALQLSSCVEKPAVTDTAESRTENYDKKKLYYNPDESFGLFFDAEAKAYAFVGKTEAIVKYSGQAPAKGEVINHDNSFFNLGMKNGPVVVMDQDGSLLLLTGADTNRAVVLVPQIPSEGNSKPKTDQDFYYNNYIDLGLIFDKKTYSFFGDENAIADYTQKVPAEGTVNDHGDSAYYFGAGSDPVIRMENDGRILLYDNAVDNVPVVLTLRDPNGKRIAEDDGKLYYNYEKNLGLFLSDRQYVFFGTANEISAYTRPLEDIFMKGSVVKGEDGLSYLEKTDGPCIRRDGNERITLYANMAKEAPTVLALQNFAD